MPDVAQNPVGILKELTKNKALSESEVPATSNISLQNISYVSSFETCKLQSVGFLQPEDFSVNEEISQSYCYLNVLFLLLLLRVEADPNEFIFQTDGLVPSDIAPHPNIN